MGGSEVTLFTFALGNILSGQTRQQDVTAGVLGEPAPPAVKCAITTSCPLQNGNVSSQRGRTTDRTFTPSRVFTQCSFVSTVPVLSSKRARMTWLKYFLASGVRLRLGLVLIFVQKNMNETIQCSADYISLQSDTARLCCHPPCCCGAAAAGRISPGPQQQCTQ